MIEEGRKGGGYRGDATKSKKEEGRTDRRGRKGGSGDGRLKMIEESTMGGTWKEWWGAECWADGGRGSEK